MKQLRHFIKMDKHSKSQKKVVGVDIDIYGNPIIKKHSPDKGDGTYAGSQMYDPYKTS